jgi:uncharacterized surface protein with fasciclin (FAS1) repeats
MARLQLLLAISSVLLLVGTSPSSALLLERVIAAPQYSSLVAALRTVNLIPALQANIRARNITIFAPNNAAFAKLPKCLTTTIQGRRALRSILLYHIVPSRVIAPRNMQKLVTLQRGSDLLIRKLGVEFYVNFATKIRLRVVVNKEGIVHGIDKVLIPPIFLALKLC